ncbi:hypothetical protein GCK72_003467 [Caenorhabditis remanei]|uniref:F-box associated domain-containing protein n=1 Tax=Caenorhabditis remanei TaxID=31234 RepID=A0A6A5HTT8_CAERE|nr:hypothetical protein GCK72_003467 [Caenorhabditis remanei]KAF1771640.1 hypothetical protein GCK72_003467 [Caenorhabditis remanei]
MELPLVAFRNVADFWDPIEQYQLSKLSKKSKATMKLAIKKRSSQLILAPPLKVNFNYSVTGSYHFHQPVYINYGLGNHPRFSPGFLDRCFQTVNDLKDLFNSEFRRIHFFPNHLSWEDLYRIVNWINRDESLPSIPVMTMATIKDNGMFFKILMENLEKNLRNFTIWGMERGQKSLKIRHNFEIEELCVNDTSSLDVDAFTSLKFNRAYLRGVDIQSEEINEILMSWKMGRFGEKMESITVEKKGLIDLRVLLIGLEVELRDPRITKRSWPLPDGTPGWLYGGIDVKGVNEKTATIWLYSYQTANEDDPIPEGMIQEYERSQGNLNQIAWDDEDPMRDAIITITFE